MPTNWDAAAAILEEYQVRLDNALKDGAKSYDAAFKATVASFKPLTDPAALAVQPAKVELVKVPRDMTVSEFNAQFPSTVPVEVVATINGLDPGGRLKAGQTAKRVVGGKLPRS